MSLYKLFVPSQAVGASLVYFDLFLPSTSVYNMTVMQVIPVVSGAVAVVGVVAVDLFLTRTTAVGTGGTAATAEGTSLTAPTFSALDSSQPVPLAQISARLTPTGGATAGAVISHRSVFSEETNSGTYNNVRDMIRGDHPDLPGLVVRRGTGIRVVQGAVASVGNIGFDVWFDLKSA